MEKFYNDIVTFLDNMNYNLKLAIVAFLGIIALLMVISMVKRATKSDEKIKFKFSNLIFLAIDVALIIFIARVGF